MVADQIHHPKIVSFAVEDAAPVGSMRNLYAADNSFLLSSSMAAIAGAAQMQLSCEGTDTRTSHPLPVEPTTKSG